MVIVNSGAKWVEHSFRIRNFDCDQSHNLQDVNLVSFLGPATDIK